MAGKKTTPDQITEVVILREAGYTTAMIAAKTSLSPATIKRYCASNKVKRGSLSNELISNARNEVMNSIAGNDELKAMTANMIADNLAINQIIREKILESVEQLEPKDTESAALCLRGLTAASSSLKSTTDAVKSLLGFDHLQGGIEVLEELVYVDLSEADIKEMRRQQSEEMKILNGEVVDQSSVSESPTIIPDDNDIIDESIH